MGPAGRMEMRRPLQYLMVLAVFCTTLILAVGCFWHDFPNPSDSDLLDEDFGGSLTEKWNLYGDPLPITRADIGNPAPCFENNGDSSWDSWATSKVTFDFSGGLVIEADLYVQGIEGGCWTTSALGLLSSYDYDLSKAAQYSVCFWLTYIGSRCEEYKAGVVEGGTVLAFVRKADGTLEQHQVSLRHDLLGAWHRFKIVIEPSLHVTYYIDGGLFYRTDGTLPQKYNNMPVLLGGRSYSYGDAFHDNIRVYHLE